MALTRAYSTNAGSWSGTAFVRPGETDRILIPKENNILTKRHYMLLLDGKRSK
jgi:hypothetical protein